MTKKKTILFTLLFISFALLFAEPVSAESKFNIAINEVFQDKNFQRVSPNEFLEKENYEVILSNDGFYYISSVINFEGEKIFKDYIEYKWNEEELRFLGENLINSPVDFTGDKEKIKWIQESLTIADLYTDVDGSFGAGSKRSLREFKRLSGLGDNDIFDRATEHELWRIRREKSAKYFDTVDVLVNKEHFIPKEYSPKTAVANVKSFKKILVSEIIKSDLEKMFSDAKAAGHNLVILSGYRSYDYQRTLFLNSLNKKGFEQAEKEVAIPGESEHQTGLAVDLSSSDYNYNLGKGFESTNAFKWLNENCWKYGFILRYLDGKTDVTGYIYEPWHYRYLGDMEKAKYIMENNLTYEEYLELKEE